MIDFNRNFYDKRKINDDLYYANPSDIELKLIDAELSGEDLGPNTIELKDYIDECGDDLEYRGAA